MAREKLLAGYARMDITPKDPVPLAGYGGSDHRISQRVLDPLYATAIAVTGTNGETVFFVTTDALTLPSSLAKRIREKVREQIDVPEKNFFIAATHSHSTPDKGRTDFPEIVANNDYFVDQAAKACLEAYADRSPAVLYRGGKATAGLNFVRHYRMEDGTYAGSNFGDFKKRIVGFAAYPDHRIRLVQFRREVGKDILLVNFQAHPCCTGGLQKFDVSADYIGVVRSQVEAATGCDFAYFLGASGNVNMVTWWGTQRIFKSGENEPYGKALAEQVLEAMIKLRPIDGTEVRAVSRDVVLIHDHSEDDMVEKVRPVVEYFRTSYDRKGADKMAQDLGYNSVYALGSILGRAAFGPSETLSVSAAAVGGIGFVGAPYEMFSQNGLAIRDKSAMEETVIMSCCNGAQGYLAADEAFEHGCYEVDNRRFVRGTAEQMENTYLKMLKELHEAIRPEEA